MRSEHRAALALLLGCAVSGCSVYDASLLDAGPRRDAGRVDAGEEVDAGEAMDAGEPEDAGEAMDAGEPEDAGPGVDSGPPDGGPDCPLFRAPSRPAGMASGDTTVVVGLRDPVFNQNDGRWETMAYDLDGYCTDEVSDVTECVAPEGGATQVDGMGGVDNVVGSQIFRILVNFDPTFEAEAAARMVGGRSIVVRIDGWNRMDDDSRVDVRIAQAVGLERMDGMTTPQWDGEDEFQLSPGSFRDGNIDAPLIRDDNAYVAGGRLVMRIPDRQAMTLPWSDGEPFDLLLTDALLTGDLVEDGGGRYRLERAWITGRYALIDFLPVLSEVGICPGEIIRGIVEVEVREDLDVRSTPGSGGPGVECDAMSLGMQFTGYPARWGDLGTDPPTPPDPCP